MLDDTLQAMKLALRVSGDEFDGEVEMLASAALADMERAGVSPEVVAEEGPLVRQAMACYCKAHFGFDNPDAARLDESYRMTVAGLLNSSANVACSERP